MPDVQHSTLTSAELHEPKGVAAAAAGAVYIANGAGSGSWSQPVVDADDGAAGEVPVANGAGDVVWSPRQYTISHTFSDVSTPGQVYLPIPYAGNVVKVIGVLGAAITGADETITVKDNAGNSMGAIAIANAGSAAGDVDTLAPASNQDVTNDDWIEIETAGSSTGPAPWAVLVVVERSA